MIGRFRCEEDRRATIQRHAVQASLIRITRLAPARSEQYLATHLIDADHVAHQPCALGELADHTSIASIDQVQMAPPIALREPDDAVVVLQDVHRRPVVGIAVELHAGIAALLLHGAHAAGTDIHLDQTQPCWVVMARDRRIDLAGIGRPAQHAGFGQCMPALGNGDAACGAIHLADEPRIADLLDVAQQAQPYFVHDRAEAGGRRGGQVGIGQDAAFVVAHAEQALAVRRPGHRERWYLHPAFPARNAAQCKIGQYPITVRRLTIKSERPSFAVGAAPQPQIVLLDPHAVPTVRRRQVARIDGRR